MACNCNSPPSALFPGVCGEDDTDVESARTLSEPDQDFLERTLLTAATDQNSRESGSSLPERLPAEELPCQRPNNPQSATPALYVPWQEVAQQMGIPVVHEELTADLRTWFNKPLAFSPQRNKKSFIDCKALPSAESLSRRHRSKRLPQSSWAPCVRYILGFRIGKSCYGTWPSPTSSG